MPPIISVMPGPDRNVLRGAAPNPAALTCYCTRLSLTVSASG